MEDAGFDKGLRSAEVRTGLRLLGRTLLGYRTDSIRSILGALLWMSMVVAVPYLVKITIDRAIDGDDASVLAPLVGVVLLAGALQSVGIGLRRYFGFRLSYRAEADLRNRMFEHTQRLAFEFHDQTTTGELMARASSDLSQVRLVFAMLPITLANIAMFISVVVVLVLLDPVLGLTAGLTVPALFFTANRYAGKVLRLSFDLQTRLAGLSEVVEEAIAGITVVKSYGQESQESARLEESADGIFAKSMEMTRIRSRFSPLFEFIPTAGTVAVLWLGGLRVVDGAITLGDFVAFTQYLTVLVLPLRITGWFFANLPRAAASATRVQELLGTAPQIASASDPIPLGSGSGAVSFRDVSFSYPGGATILEGVDLDIPGGTSVGLVGATGSGKTTLAHLIPRFYDVDAGTITVDGVDVRRLDLDVLRNEVAVVFQETFLFSASIRDNIAVGNPDATDEQIRLAARLARAHDFICGMPEGYETVVGERGESLSGGQRQRVALARAVVRDPRILILDDATSSVDAVVEAEIQEALRRVMRDRTTIIIAHRTSTLALVDRVAFIEDSRVVAFDTHENLLRTVPRYSEVLAQVEAAP